MIVCKIYRPSITLDASIILFMCLIEWGDCREDPHGLLNREIASTNFSGNIVSLVAQ